MSNRRRVERRHPGPPAAIDDRWPELLAVAARIFARKGYASTTLQDVADGVGLLKGSLYHYIRGKEDLLFAVVRSNFADGLASLQAVAASDLDPVERLRAVVRGHVLHLIDNLDRTTVLLHDVDRLSAARRAEVPLREYQQLIEDLVADARTDPRVKPDVDPRLAALAVLGATNWVYRWYRPGGSSSPQAVADAFADLLVDGMLRRTP